MSEANIKPKKERVVVYIDGFNLYFGIIDAYQDRYDMAMLISGDSDLVPPIRAIHEWFSIKRVLVAFPPKRHNSSVALVAKGSLTIGRKKLADSQFDIEVSKRDGFILRKPREWD
jgi:hypothetical protein